MSRAKQQTIRVALSLAFGLSVSLVTLSSVVGGGGPRVIGFPQIWTRKQLKRVESELQTFRARRQTYPARLQDLEGDRRDGWRRDFRYSLPMRPRLTLYGKPLIESLGRDGVRGGVGLDADLSNQNLHPPQSEIPPWQILTHPLSQNMIVAALVCGMLAGWLFFHGLAKQPFDRKSWPLLGATFVTAFVVALFGAALITSVHIPSGH